MSDLELAFLAEWDGDFEVYLIRADGSGLVQFTINDTHDDGPKWAPDGNTIGYIKDILGSPRLIVSQAAGSEGTSVSPGLEASSDFVWSPAGSSVVLRSQDDLFLVDVDTGDAINLTLGADLAPGLASFSPDGSRLVFPGHAPEGSPRLRMYMVNSDGTGLTELSFPSGDVYRPTWSPVAEEILFEGVSQEAGVGLYIATPQGEITRLPLEPKYRAPEADWSPDGTMIAYIVRFDEANPAISRHRLRIATPNGDMDIPVLGPPEDVEAEFVISEFVWAPDNRYMAYSVPSIGGGDLEVDLHILDLCNGTSTLVVEAINAFATPSWRPIP